MEVILAGGKMQRLREAWLPRLPPVNRVLLVGEGPGRFLEAILRRQPQVSIVCVDASAGMLRVARDRLRRSGFEQSRVEFVHGELPGWRPPDGYFELIGTHFFLDCFPPELLREVVSSLARGAVPGAHWLWSDFREPDAGFQRWRARLMLAVMYQFFRRVTQLKAAGLTCPEPYLVEQGFVSQGRHTADWGLLHSDWWMKA